MLDALLRSQEMDLRERYMPVKSDYQPGYHRIGWWVAVIERRSRASPEQPASPSTFDLVSSLCLVKEAKHSERLFLRASDDY
jgi:hypothetical protein